MSIPIIDLSAEHESVVGSIKDACIKWGFFQIVNHGLHATTLEGLQLALQGFFVQTSTQNKTQVFRTKENARGSY